MQGSLKSRYTYTMVFLPICWKSPRGLVDLGADWIWVELIVGINSAVKNIHLKKIIDLLAFISKSLILQQYIQGLKQDLFSQKIRIL